MLYDPEDFDMTLGEVRPALAEAYTNAGRPRDGRVVGEPVATRRARRPFERAIDLILRAIRREWILRRL